MINDSTNFERFKKTIFDAWWKKMNEKDGRMEEEFRDFFKNEDLALPNVMDGENGIGWKNIFSIIWKQGYRWLLIWHFCPDLNCVSRTWYYVFHAYRLCRDLGENTVRRKTTISTASGEKEESCTAFYPTRGFYLKKKNPHPCDFSFQEMKNSKIQERERGSIYWWWLLENFVIGKIICNYI